MSWLQEYSWTARLTKWGWFLAMLIAQIVFVPWMLEGQGNGWQPHLTCALTLGAAFSAAGSFRRERETGLLEALLVTPLTPLQIVAGRLWGIFCHYLPALLALVGFWGAELWLTRRTPNEWSLLWPDPMGFVAVMILGVYLSLFRLSFFFAWLTTWLVGFVFSALVCLPLVRLLPEIPHSSELCPFVLRLCLAAGVWCLLMRKVHSRGFVETPRKPAEA